MARDIDRLRAALEEILASQPSEHSLFSHVACVAKMHNVARDALRGVVSESPPEPSFNAFLAEHVNRLRNRYSFGPRFIELDVMGSK